MRTTALLALSIAVAGGAGYWIVSDDGDRADELAEVAPKGEKARAKKKGLKSSTKGLDRSPQASDDRERIDRLEKRVAQLEAQLRMRAGTSSESPPSFDLDGPVATAQIHEVVEGALADVREAEQERRDDRRSERMRENREESLAALVQAAGFAAEKSQQISEMWASEQEQITDLVAQARSGELEWRDLRGQAQRIRGETDSAAYEGMNEDQKTAYDENRPGPGGGGGGRGGGRG